MPNPWSNGPDFMSTSLNTNSAFGNTAGTFTYTWRDPEMTAALIDEPAFIQIDMLNGTRITGRVDRYSDPKRADAYGAFVQETDDGGSSYILWAGILRVTVFPLTATNPSVPPPEQIKDAPKS